MPDSSQQLLHGKTGISFPEFLISLKGKDPFQVSGFHPVIKEPIVTDLMKAGRKHMHQEAPDEFLIADGDLAFGFSRFPAPGRERCMGFCHGKNPAVGDGNPVCIASKIFDGVAKAVKGFLDIRAPVFLIEPVFPLVPGIGIL